MTALYNLAFVSQSLYHDYNSSATTAAKHCYGMSWIALRANKSVCKCGDTHEFQQSCGFVPSVTTHFGCEESKSSVRESIPLPAGKHKVCKQWKRCYLERTFVLGSTCPLVTLSHPRVWWISFPWWLLMSAFEAGRPRMFQDEEWRVSSRPFLAAQMLHSLIFFALLEEYPDTHCTYTPLPFYTVAKYSSIYWNLLISLCWECHMWCIDSLKPPAVKGQNTWVLRQSICQRLAHGFVYTYIVLFFSLTDLLIEWIEDNWQKSYAKFYVKCTWLKIFWQDI